MKVICDYTRNFNKDCLEDTELQVGDAVYYLAPSSTYSIRKSVITEKRIFLAETLSVFSEGVS